MLTFNPAHSGWALLPTRRCVDNSHLLGQKYCTSVRRFQVCKACRNISRHNLFALVTAFSSLGVELVKFTKICVASAGKVELADASQMPVKLSKSFV